MMAFFRAHLGSVYMFQANKKKSKFLNGILQRTQRYILNSFIKTGFGWATACHDRADDANARFPRVREVLLVVAARRDCMVEVRWNCWMPGFGFKSSVIREATNHSTRDSHPSNHFYFFIFYFYFIFESLD